MFCHDLSDKLQVKNGVERHCVSEPEEESSFFQNY